mmetsp:Transcript_57687/g.122733  ORF Transcript_57687/g.122733 Transcript_57687/m.122733 type:complete len:646 (+) Transcript_57687:87-2024(+)|eukprot:CAMPEP_0206611278 /NCGR_PEP_ID=MMETSP0325_2-20121206/55146_1 /ASSEMBLY_ACC=CAM_ASM_000347 /TAXON_ID=2866 /ORGANISM="Crypthecodinium cohnii, Strain Seligo" /LENGTH=645 /DNA_ID=CAMNT_0054130443 /DNA_START=6 /DNA_END=1943 /DNA_ORIENTATION=-
MKLSYLLALVGAHCSLISAKKINFLKLGAVNASTAKEFLDHELADVEAAVVAQRLRTMEDAMRPMYKALPKNEEGTLDHLTVRYALHRFFNNRSGWFIRGLEPNSAEIGGQGAQNPDAKEWIPNFLQEQLEKRFTRSHKGANLEQLAALAAALQDLVQEEAKSRVEGVYEMHALPQDRTLTREELDEVIRTYYISFLLAGNFSASSVWELKRKKEVFARKYTGWFEAEAWLEKLLDRVLAGNTLRDDFSFADTLDVANGIGQQYYEFNDLECTDLKDTLRGLEGKKAGRVRLAAFYNKGLYSHWRFTEKIEYLRSLGALDESDSQRPYVLIANYAMARTNCLDSSNLYGICCRNDCEPLMGTLETSLGKSEASPEEIANIVSNLPSSFVTAPRPLSELLTTRLDSIAEQNGGKVPIHGRLFAQWMHHAYPLECPYPHERGSINPQTPDEWMKETGHEEETASTEEIMEHVQRDTCAVSFKGKVDCDGESEELPWTETEELLQLSPNHWRGDVSPTAASEEDVVVSASEEASDGTVLLLLAVMAVSLGLAVALRRRLPKSLRDFGGLLPHLKEDEDSKASKLSDEDVGQRKLVATFVVLALVGIVTGILDVRVAAVGGALACVILIISSLAQGKGKAAQSGSKCIV